MIYVIDFHPIVIYTRLAPQNECRNLNFVKDKYVGGKKMARNGGKMTKRKICVLFKFPDFRKFVKNWSFIKPYHILLFLLTGLAAHWSLIISSMKNFVFP